MKGNPYLRVRASVASVSEEEIMKAEVVTSVDAVLESSLSLGEYEFTKNADLSKAFKAIKRAEIVKYTANNGVDEFNRIKVWRESENLPNLLYIWGNKDRSLLEPRTLTDAELAKIAFGYCKQAGEIVTDARRNPKTGKIQNIARPYCDITAILA